MNEKGGNGHVRSEEHFDLDSNMLLEAIFHYIAERGIKYGPGVEIEWNVDFNEGYNVPKEAIKDISVRCYLGKPQGEK
jgi:hypothetical protein